MHTQQPASYQTLVLIETYWNVNNFAGVNEAGNVAVLIETYWNVNVVLCIDVFNNIGLNRNILECK